MLVLVVPSGHPISDTVNLLVGGFLAFWLVRFAHSFGVLP